MTDPRWKDIAALYENMYKTEDLSQILRLPITQFKKALKQSPAGLRDAIKIEVATRIEAGTFDSIAKIKAVDEICGTDLLTTAVG